MLQKGKCSPGREELGQLHGLEVEKGLELNTAVPARAKRGKRHTRSKEAEREDMHATG